MGDPKHPALSLDQMHQQDPKHRWRVGETGVKRNHLAFGRPPLDLSTWISRWSSKSHDVEWRGWAREASREATLPLDARVLTQPSAPCAIDIHEL